MDEQQVNDGLRNPSRRQVLMALALAPAGSLLRPGKAWAGTLARPGGVVVPTGTTLAQTFLAGPAVNAGGYKLHVLGAGEPHLVREELGASAQAGREARRLPVVTLGHLTDVHLVDAQSPARVEFLDRYSDAPTTAVPFGAAYRPQEPLGSRVGDAMVAALNALAGGPVCGQPLALTLVTGDIVDNLHQNELRWVIGLLDGGSLRPDSGDTTKWEGVHDQDALTYDEHYWHPDGTPGTLPTAVDDIARATYGYPTVPGMLDAARAPFSATGLRMPWFSVHGNHDGLVQGNVPEDAALNAIATGPVKVVGAPAGLSPGDLASASPTTLLGATNAPSRVVTADPARKLVTLTESVMEHFTTTGTPVGHGYTQQNVADGTAYYTVDLGPVKIITLDTVNPGGNSDGSIDQAQLAWLTAELEKSSTSKLAADGSRVPASGTRDQYVVITSHHTTATLSNPVPAVGETAARVLASTVVPLLLSYPNVVAWINGHTHVNSVFVHPLASGAGGFWEVSTASHCDWPQQCRVIELVDNVDGTLSLFATVVDSAAPYAWDGRLDSGPSLASLSRELALNDWQERARPDPAVDGRRGALMDRNVELLIPAPFRTAATITAPVVVPPPAVAAPAPGLAYTGLGAGTVAAGLGAVAAAAVLRRIRAGQPADEAVAALREDGTLPT